MSFCWNLQDHYNYHNFPINKIPLFTVIEEKSSSERSLPALENTLRKRIEEFKSRESRGSLPVPAGGGHPKPAPGAGYSAPPLPGARNPTQPPEPVPPPAAPVPVLSDFSAPPPPTLRDSSDFQTIVSGTNPLDRLYKASKQKELRERQNLPLEGTDLREKLNHSRNRPYHPTEESYEERPYRPQEQGNLLKGIAN